MPNLVLTVHDNVSSESASAPECLKGSQHTSALRSTFAWVPGPALSNAAGAHYCVLQEAVAQRPKDAEFWSLLSKATSDMTYLDEIQGEHREKLTDADRQAFNRQAMEHAKKVIQLASGFRFGARPLTM